MIPAIRNPASACVCSHHSDTIPDPLCCVAQCPFSRKAYVTLRNQVAPHYQDKSFRFIFYHQVQPCVNTAPPVPCMRTVRECLVHIRAQF